MFNFPLVGLEADSQCQMKSSKKVIVSLTSFGAAEVKRHGQGWFIALCKQADADGVEIRAELLQGHSSELIELGQLVDKAGLDCVFSSPLMLWNAGGQLDRQGLEHAMASARGVGAEVLKLSIGRFNTSSRADFSMLSEQLARSGLSLLIENDQTVGAGSVSALQDFFQAADDYGVNLGMTFDVGNWHWVGECPLEAAKIFSGRVRYVHCKGVQRQPSKWVAVPLAGSFAPWRSVLRSLPQDVPHAIEFPLVGDDLLKVTREAVSHLRTLEDQP